MSDNLIIECAIEGCFAPQLQRRAYCKDHKKLYTRLREFAAWLYTVHEQDWMEYANCPVAEPADKSFIEKPTPQQAELWATTCAQCPVFSECFDWANREGITGAYIAGEWRE